MNCSRCGNMIPDSAEVCGACGAPVYRKSSPTDSKPDALAHTAVAPQRGSSAGKEPKSRKKLAVLIAIIGLVLIIAILGGAYLINRARTDDLKEAEENYQPPAEVIEIDLSKDDPSDDRIRFTYDDRLRVANCTYTLKGKEYQQRYEYDDAEREINISTIYKSRYIDKVTVSYDQVSEPDVFMSVSGCYVRMDQESLYGKTDEDPTGIQVDYKQLYIDYLNNVIIPSSSVHDRSGKLFYINDDAIPELLLFESAGAHSATFRLCWIQDEAVHEKTFDSGQLKYQERGGYIYTSIGGADYLSWDLLYFDGRSLGSRQTGSYRARDYSDPDKGVVYGIDGAEVSREEYESAISEFDDWESMYDRDEWTALNDLPDYIRIFA